jgi:hypothetical protein
MDKVDVRELVQVSARTGNDETRRNAGSSSYDCAALSGAVAVHPFSQIGPASIPVNEFELIHSINREELMANGAAQPSWKRSDRSADVRVWVIRGVRVVRESSKHRDRCAGHRLLHLPE